MPDGDIIHTALPKRFWKVYKQMCEGHWSPAEIGHNLLQPLKKQIASYGDAPVELGNSLVSFLCAVQNRGNPIDVDRAFAEIDAIAQKPEMSCSPRARNLMKEAAKKLLLDLQPTENVAIELMRTYCELIYVKDFESPISVAPEHYQGASHEHVEAQKHVVRPHIERGLDQFARQLTVHGTVTKLRRPPRPKKMAFSLSDSPW